jgi:hypothetical protein
MAGAYDGCVLYDFELKSLSRDAARQINPIGVVEISIHSIVDFIRFFFRYEFILLIFIKIPFFPLLC